MTNRNLFWSAEKVCKKIKSKQTLNILHLNFVITKLANEMPIIFQLLYQHIFVLKPFLHIITHFQQNGTCWYWNTFCYSVRYLEEETQCSAVESISLQKHVVGSTVPNNSYCFWADLLHKWPFLWYDWHP